MSLTESTRFFVPYFCFTKENGWYGSSWPFFTLIIVLSSLKSLSPIALVDDDDVLLSTNLELESTIFQGNENLPGAVLFSGSGYLSMKNNCFIHNYFENIRFAPTPSFFEEADYVFPVNVAEAKAVLLYQTSEFIDIPHEENYPRYIESVGNYASVDENYLQRERNGVIGRRVCGLHNWTINDILFGRKSDCIQYFDAESTAVCNK